MFDWHKYLNLAESLLSEDASEEVLRTSVSRAYYSVYNLCKEKYLKASTINRIDKVDSHKFLIDKYKQSKKVAKSIGFKLDTLKLARINSDYEGKKPLKLENAKKSVELAKIIVDEDLKLIDESYFT